MGPIVLKKALVVDPDGDSRSLLALRLEILGFQVREVENHSELGQTIQQEDWDLIVSEMALPGLEGEALMRVLEPARRPVLVFTQWELKETASFVERTRVQMVISKRKRSELFKKLEELDLSAREGRGAAAAPGGKHILLIEDSATIRKTIRRVLEKGIPNCVIREAEDGRDAISEMAQKKVDLIVTDLQMPGMDGRTFLRMIRRNTLLRNKPVVVLSSSDLTELKEEFAEDGRIEFLHKPSTPEEILTCIDGLFTREGDPARNLRR